ncbi:CocE/NonD family hydrolase [Altererythrobacter sp. CC-YST694]|uniref:CocE/NonD family hydrolase n=1 Tax=Altererythrobacter sp. CC-YST694 TaxID=2755038 RepID=UPI001D032421|nr:CocE/NonD family hydrolase [Altererythrobacter sp. CC-YST694]
MKSVCLCLAASLAGLGQVAYAQAYPAPAYPAQAYPDVKRTSLYVPVRDGTRLAVNIYRPSRSGAVEAQPLPTIFVFTPYRARYRDEKGATVETALSDSLALRSLLQAGYVVAVADIRGKGASFGHRHGFQDRTEARDGYDLVEWLASQPFSNGKVGMIGCSYLGGTTFHTATTAPPSLKAVFIGASDLDKYAFVRNGGITAQFNTRPDEAPEVDLASEPVDADPDGTQLKQAVAEHGANTPMAQLWYSMPFRDSVSPLTGNDFWNEVAVYRYLDAIKDAGIATYFWGNWQDEPTSQVILGAANLGGKFLAGPGGHCASPQGFDFAGEMVRYFDHYLKGIPNGIEAEPRATYWVEGLGGQGEYVRSAQLPGVQSRPLAWYFAGGRSGTARSVNDGRLAIGAGAPGMDSFAVDYDLPPADYFAFWAGPMDHKGLSYTSEPLKKPLPLVGFPVARLAVATDNPQADLWVYLDLVQPDRPVEVISFGRIKLAQRKLAQAPYDTLGQPWHSGLSKDAEPPQPGARVPVSLALTAMSRVIPAGARLRVTIAGADPRQRNIKDIALDPAPTIKVFFGGEDGSRIELPLAEELEK